MKCKKCGSYIPYGFDNNRLCEKMQDYKKLYFQIKLLGTAFVVFAMVQIIIALLSV